MRDQRSGAGGKGGGFFDPPNAMAIISGASAAFPLPNLPRKRGRE
jgi:hypothetical protein